MRHRAGLFLILWVVGACGCAAPLTHVYDAKRLAPEGWWRIIHARVEECLGRTRSFDEIEWYITRPGVIGEVGEVAPGTGSVAGLWSAPNRIFLDSRYAMAAGVIRHEAAHYIMGTNGDHHADPLFIKCTS